MFHLLLPPHGFRYNFRCGDLPQHSVCCPLNRTFIMKTVILAVLLLFAVACIVSGAPTESGKSRYENAKFLRVFIQTLQIYKIVSLLNYKLRHEDVWKNGGKTPGILTSAPEA